MILTSDILRGVERGSLSSHLCNAHDHRLCFLLFQKSKCIFSSPLCLFSLLANLGWALFGKEGNYDQWWNISFWRLVTLQWWFKMESFILLSGKLVLIGHLCLLQVNRSVVIMTLNSKCRSFLGNFAYFVSIWVSGCQEFILTKAV